MSVSVSMTVNGEAATTEVIKIVNVHKTYLLGIEGVPALRGVNLTVQDGEFITILGTSGGGKTTLLNIIGTIDKPSKGSRGLHLVQAQGTQPTGLGIFWRPQTTSQRLGDQGQQW